VSILGDASEPPRFRFLFFVGLLTCGLVCLPDIGWL
jgi:hypothetical protein